MAMEALRAHIQAFSSLAPSALKDYEARLRQLVRDVAPEPEPEAEPEQGSGQGPPPEVAAQLAAAQRLLSVLAGMAAAHEDEEDDEEEDEERVYVEAGSDSYTRGKEEGWRAAMGPRVLHFDLVSPLRGGLWADRIWPSATVLAGHLDSHPGLVEGRSVLEIGAGAALPSVVAALRGARAQVVSDYPDELMLANTRKNLQTNLPPERYERTAVVGHDWSTPPQPLLAALAGLDGGDGPAGAAEGGGFELLLLSDLLYSCEHEPILTVIAATLSTAPRIRCSFEPP